MLGLRPQRSGVKDVRCRANEATLIRFWPPSALTSSSRTPVPWRGDTFDLRLVCRRHVALLLFCFLPQNSTPLTTFSSGRLWSSGGGRRRTVKRKKKSNQIKYLKVSSEIAAKVGGWGAYSGIGGMNVKNIGRGGGLCWGTGIMRRRRNGP